MHVILALGIYYQVEAATYLDRDWDQFKADNPFGSGNKANKRCWGVRVYLNATPGSRYSTRFSMRLGLIGTEIDPEATYV